MKGLFVINPNAGMRMFQQGAHEVAKHLLQNGTINYCSILYTRKGGDAFEITSGLKPGEWDFVLAAGGDGTVNEVVNGLATSNCGIPLLILGAGTTNDFITAVGIGRTPATLERLIKDFCVKEADIGVCNGHYFLNSCSGGVISNIAHSISPEQKAQFGILAYYSAGLSEIVEGNFKTAKIRITTPEETFDEEVFLLVIANSCQAGGFQNVAPKSRLNDGLLDVVLIKDVGAFDILPLIGMIQTGQHLNDKHIRFFQTNELRAELLDGDREFKLDYDGEFAGDMPLNVSVSDRKLKLIVPRRSLKVRRLFGS